MTRAGMSYVGSFAVAALLALGCGNKPESPPAGAGSAGASSMAGSSVAAGSAAAAAGSAGSAGSAAADSPGSAAAAAPETDVPTQTDFEDDATAKITDKNVEAQVKAIEQQLEQK